jgi:hypothetical protein
MQADGTSNALGTDGVVPLDDNADDSTMHPERSRRGGNGWRFIVGGVFVVVVAAGVAGAVAVANRGSTKSPLMILQAAAAHTTSVRTAHVTASETITSGPDTLRPLDMNADADYVNKRSSLAITVNGAPVEDVRVVGGVTYLSLERVVLPAGTHWVSIRASDLKSAQKSYQALRSLNNDPSQGLQFLSGISGAPVVLDTETLDGVAVTRYATTLNLQGMLDASARGDTALGTGSIASAIAAMRQYTDVTHVPSEEWIDGSGRVRRFTMTLTLSDGSDKGTVLLDLRFSRFNQPLSITAPPAADTVPFTQVPNLFKDLARSAGETR